MFTDIDLAGTSVWSDDNDLDAFDRARIPRTRLSNELVGKPEYALGHGSKRRLPYGTQSSEVCLRFTEVHVGLSQAHTPAGYHGCITFYTFDSAQPNLILWRDGESLVHRLCQRSRRSHHAGSDDVLPTPGQTSSHPRRLAEIGHVSLSAQQLLPNAARWFPLGRAAIRWRCREFRFLWVHLDDEHAVATGRSGSASGRIDLCRGSNDEERVAVFVRRPPRRRTRAQVSGSSNQTTSGRIRPPQWDRAAHRDRRRAQAARTPQDRYPQGHVIHAACLRRRNGSGTGCRAIRAHRGCRRVRATHRRSASPVNCGKSDAYRASARCPALGCARRARRRRWVYQPQTSFGSRFHPTRRGEILD